MRNPYERRRDRAMREAVPRAEAFGLNPMMAGPRESPVAFQDIEALVVNAYRRATREAEERHEVALRHARREAWDEGRSVGVDDGRAEMLGRIDDRFGDEVHAAITASREMLSKFAADLRKVQKGELAERLDRHTGLLEGLVEAHHASFVEIPF